MNLTEVIVRASDTYYTLAKKIAVATILGTYQSTLTNFPYLRKIWKQNTEAERLLGVSLTGIMDNFNLSNIYLDTNIESLLTNMKGIAVETNAQFADILGIPVSAAITCVKPSGTVSQLCDTASGLHPRHSKYYIRRVRSDAKDPITQFMISQGVPNEPDVTKPDSTVVFSFPMEAPDDALLRKDLTAVQHFTLWLLYQRHWCEHKPSVTINVTDNEWLELGAKVYEHFDEVSGVAFLPYDGGSYRQAPYEEIDEEAYKAMLALMPAEIKWEDFIEIDDNVEGAQTLACVAGHCEI